MQLTPCQCAAGQFGYETIKLAELIVDCRGIVSPLKQGKISSPGHGDEVNRITLCHFWQPMNIVFIWFILYDT